MLRSLSPGRWRIIPDGRTIAPRPQPEHGVTVRKDTATPGRPTTGKQVNVRMPADILDDLQLISEELSLDLSNVIRMILSQQRHQYVEQVRAARAKREAK